MNLQNNKTKNFTPLPNEIFSLHLSTGELVTYAVLMRLEDPRTYECWPSYETIGKSIGKSKSSVKRYVAGLVEKGLIGSRIVVPKDKLRAWIDANSGTETEPL